MKQAGSLVALVLAGAVCAQTVPDFGFMPDGGRTLFVQVFGTDTGANAQLAKTGDLAEWTDRIVSKGTDLDERQIRTLAGFLAATTPVPQVAGSERLGIAAILPRDGRDIALSECQSCHSLFTGYLMQNRTHEGWLAVFKSPFHMTMKLTDTEREVFADYSAINMPLRPDDVPAELRF